MAKFTKTDWAVVIISSLLVVISLYQTGFLKLNTLAVYDDESTWYGYQVKTSYDDMSSYNNPTSFPSASVSNVIQLKSVSQTQSSCGCMGSTAAATLIIPNLIHVKSIYINVDGNGVASQGSSSSATISVKIGNHIQTIYSKSVDNIDSSWYISNVLLKFDGNFITFQDGSILAYNPSDTIEVHFDVHSSTSRSRRSASSSLTVNSIAVEKNIPLVCSEGQQQTSTCNDGVQIASSVCKDNAWVSTGNQCPEHKNQLCT